MPFSTIPEIIEELRQGHMIILVDDEDRENEGDLVCAAELIRPEMINFMIRSAAGKLCLALTAEKCEAMNLHQQAADNTAEHSTAFTVSIDAAPEFGVTTGVSAADRCATIHRTVADDCRPSDLRRPGHISPLRARPGGVLVRAGHTEASVDLARLAGLKPAGVIIEILKEDGTIARLPDLQEFAKKHDLKIGTIASLVEYRQQREHIITRLERVHLPTRWGNFDCILYDSPTEGKEHLALVCGGVGDLDDSGQPVQHDEPVLVRVHSSCLTGDLLSSLRCDCGDQLWDSLLQIAAAGKGAFVYLLQEGRGIGLRNKLYAYKLQENGLDTVEANEALGFRADRRDYGIGAQILHDLGLTKIRILTNNPKKVSRLDVYGLQVVEQLPIRGPETKYNARYLNTKREKLGHLL